MLRATYLHACATCHLFRQLPTGTWDDVPAAVRAKVGARLGPMGALRSLDAALRMLAQHGSSDQLHEV